MSILDDVNAQIGQMSPDQIAEEFRKVVKQREEHKAKQAAYNAKPEVKEKRKAYSEEYRKKDPEGFKAKRAAYMKKPEVKERMKGYRQERNAKQKAIVDAYKKLVAEGKIAAPAEGTGGEAQQASA